jgi:hypothetical protein
MRGKNNLFIICFGTNVPNKTRMQRNKDKRIECFGFLERNIPVLAFNLLVGSYWHSVPFRTSSVVTFLSASCFCSFCIEDTTEWSVKVPNNHSYFSVLCLRSKWNIVDFMATKNNRVISDWNFSQHDFWRFVKSDWGIYFSKYCTVTDVT